MDCRTAESLINKYIDRKLTMKQLEDFLDHIESCPSCRDELETYFIVNNALKRLDDDKGTFDMGKLLEDDFKRRKARVRHHRIKNVMLVVLVLFVIAFLGFELILTTGILNI